MSERARCGHLNFAGFAPKGKNGSATKPDQNFAVSDAPKPGT